jgi:hypothetical protein
MFDCCGVASVFYEYYCDVWMIYDGALKRIFTTRVGAILDKGVISKDAQCCFVEDLYKPPSNR